MNLLETAQALGAYLAPLVATAYPDMPVLWDNDPQQRPDDDTAFVRISLRPAADRQGALGKTLRERSGVVMVQIFSPKGNGDGLALQIADNFNNWLFMQAVGPFQFYGVDHNVIGERDAFFQVNLSATYTGLTA